MSTGEDGFSHGRAGLEAGGIHYRERGSGRPVVFVHGFLVNGRIWDGTASILAATNRCIVPDWPMGSHSEAMAPGADVSARGMARIISRFLAEHELDDVTIVANDSGGAVSQILVTEMPDRVGRLVLTNCDSFEKFPPGRFKLMAKAVQPSFAYTLLAHSLRSRLVRSSPLAFGSLTRRPVDDALLRSFTEPQVRDKGVRRDGWQFIRSADPRDTLAAAERLPSLEIPALLAWGVDDRFFTVDDARRLARAIPDSRLTEIEDAATFVMLDRPAELAAAIGAFVGD